jgi:predicted AlkP superfamily phosphohydrolase/phosphomutase
MLLKYVDLNQGFVFTQNSSYLWAFLAFIFGGALLFFKFFFNFFKRFFWAIIIIILVSVIIGGIIMNIKPNKYKKVIVLGIDALDYTLTKEMMAKGELPNLSRLAQEGSFSPLATTIPAESAVAWSSFATGLNPANHGVFDFVMRNPQGYSLYLALNEISNLNRNPVIKLYRKGKTIWDILTENNIQGYFYFCPNTFPTDYLKGIMLSGMGTPDILGSSGTFTFYTTKPLTEEDADSRGKVIHTEIYSGTINTNLRGPKFSKNKAVETIQIPLKITLSPDKQAASLNFQSQNISLKAGQWSQWCKISFAVSPFRKLHGILKFYLKSVSPEFELYVTPVNFDPSNPPLPISYPNNYSKKIASKVGLYYTQGMPHNTWALSENRIDEKTFLEHVDQIFSERKKILKEELKSFKKGLFFFYFDTIDTIQHMFWRYIDPQSPLYEEDSPYGRTIADYYRKIDAVIGEVMKNATPDTMILVISDHGFNPFRESVNINRWLLENGYLAIKKPLKEVNGFLDGIDWSKTKAYSIGFGGIYLNKKGREAEGIVTDAESKNLKLKIKEGLLKLKDSKNQKAVNNVYLREDVFRGEYSDDAPDLFVGFAKGFRTSWRTAIGGVATELIEENRRKWSGDHLIDPILVPGVIFINKKIKSPHPSMIDVAPTLLSAFGLEKDKKMDGNSLI